MVVDQCHMVAYARVGVLPFFSGLDCLVLANPTDGHSLGHLAESAMKRVWQKIGGILPFFFLVMEACSLAR